jgi:hypothetical protein
LEPIHGLLKSLKIQALESKRNTVWTERYNKIFEDKGLGTDSDL